MMLAYHCQHHTAWTTGCDRCAVQVKRSRLIRAKLGPAQVPAGQVRGRLRTLLDAGCSQKGIGRASGVEQSTISRLLSGESRTVRIRQHNQIITLTVAEVMPFEERVPSTGATRRIRHLARQGWSFTHMGRETGISQATIHKLAYNRQDTVARSIHDRIESLYQNYWDRQGLSARARNIAARERWLSAWDFDDLDNPHDTGNTMEDAA